MPAQGGVPMAAPLGRLHLVTDVRRDRDPVAVVRAALSVGVPVVQVRVPDHVCDLGAYHLGTLIVGLCREAGATCLINDRLHIALAVGADGGHVGAEDLPVAAARRLLGPAAVLGATARDARSGRAAEAAGASYLGGGPAFTTRTEAGVPAPIGADGGAGGGGLGGGGGGVRGGGGLGLSVVSAVWGGLSPGAAVSELLSAVGDG